MPTQSSKLHVVSESPLRTHARTAIALTHQDVARGVLHERVAEFLCIQLRLLRGGREASLAQVPRGEADVMRQLAIGVFRLVDEIAAERPPTTFEIACYEQRKALVLAHDRVRCHAVAHGHRLSIWRPEEDRSGCEAARCERCGAGASIHLGTAQESVSGELLTSCPSTTTGFLRGV